MLQRLLNRGDTTALELSRGERVLQIHATKPANTRSLVLKTILPAYQRFAKLQGRDQAPHPGAPGISITFVTR